MNSRRGACPSLARAGGSLRSAASRERSSARRAATATREAAEIHGRGGSHRSRHKQGAGTRSRAWVVEPHSGSSTAEARSRGVGKRRLCASSPTRSFSDELLSSPTHARRRMDPSQELSNMEFSAEKYFEAVGWEPYTGQSSQATQPVNDTSVPSNQLGAEELPIQLDKQPSNHAATRGTRGRKKTVATRVKGSNFSPKEDVLVYKAWIEVSNDAAVNTGQKKDMFWDRILNVYNEHRDTLPERSVRSLQSRWEIIKKHVGKFVGFYDEALRENRSGYTDADKVTAAAAAFAEAEEQPFQFMHCWEVMKDEPKWMDTKHNKGHRISTVADNLPNYSQNMDKSDENTPNDSTASGSRAKRPMGRDATKARSKRANSSSSSASDYVTSMQVLNLEKLTALKEEYGRRHARDEEQMALEKEKVTIDREKVSIEKEKVELQRSHLDRQLTLEERRLELQKQAEDRERELALLRVRAEDERILSIDLDKCANDGLRAYYQSLQQSILARIHGGN